MCAPAAQALNNKERLSEKILYAVKTVPFQSQTLRAFAALTPEEAGDNKKLM